MCPVSMFKQGELFYPVPGIENEYPVLYQDAIYFCSSETARAVRTQLVLV